MAFDQWEVPLLAIYILNLISLLKEIKWIHPEGNYSVYLLEKLMIFAVLPMEKVFTLPWVRNNQWMRGENCWSGDIQLAKVTRVTPTCLSN